MFKITISVAVLVICYIYVCSGQATSNAKNLSDLQKELNATINANKDAQPNELMPKLKDQTIAAINSMRANKFTPTKEQIVATCQNFTVGSDTLIAKNNMIQGLQRGLGSHLFREFVVKDSKDGGN